MEILVPEENAEADDEEEMEGYEEEPHRGELRRWYNSELHIWAIETVLESGWDVEEDADFLNDSPFDEVPL